jgi:tripartite-type tricarboxylate transporter receptor subunit TctC
MFRRIFLSAALAASLAAGGGAALGQTEQPIRIVYPFAAGGSGDALARIIADELRAGTGRNVIVENQTGGAGRIGTRAVIQAAPDGNTILFTPIAPVAIYQHVYKDLGYDPFKDLLDVSHAAKFEFGIAVNADTPVKTLKELVAWIRQDPKRGSFGSPAAGTLPHFFGALFGQASGVEMVHIGYKGSAAAVADLLGGQVPMVMTPTSDLLAQHRAGKIRILATSDFERSQLVPEVPTFKEAGYDIEGTSWYGVFAPAKTPDAVVNRYSEIIAKGMKNPEIRERLLKMGLYATGMSASDFAKLRKADSDRWAPAVKASGFKVEN